MAKVRLTADQQHLRHSEDGRRQDLLDPRTLSQRVLSTSPEENSLVVLTVCQTTNDYDSLKTSFFFIGTTAFPPCLA